MMHLCGLNYQTIYKVAKMSTTLNNYIDAEVEIIMQRHIQLLHFEYFYFEVHFAECRTFICSIFKMCLYLKVHISHVLNNI